MPARPILKSLKRFGLGRFIESHARNLAKPRAELILKEVVGRRVLEVGMGMGVLAQILEESGKEVVGLDVDDTRLDPRSKPVLYEGKLMPFEDKQFDCAMIVCVLHHCDDQETVLGEAMRVAKRVIVIEDTYRNWLERKLIAWRDSVENWEFYPHLYHSWGEWRELCRGHGWRVRHVKSWSNWDFGVLYGHQTCFVLDH